MKRYPIVISYVAEIPYKLPAVLRRGHFLPPVALLGLHDGVVLHSMSVSECTGQYEKLRRGRRLRTETILLYAIFQLQFRPRWPIRVSFSSGRFPPNTCTQVHYDTKSSYQTFLGNTPASVEVQQQHADSLTEDQLTARAPSASVPGCPVLATQSPSRARAPALHNQKR